MPLKVGQSVQVIPFPNAEGATVTVVNEDGTYIVDVPDAPGYKSNSFIFKDSDLLAPLDRSYTAEEEKSYKEKSNRYWRNRNPLGTFEHV